MTALDDLMAAVGTAVDTYTPAITGPLTQQITDLQAEVAGLQTQLATTQADDDARRQKLTDALTLIASLQAELAALTFAVGIDVSVNAPSTGTLATEAAAARAVFGSLGHHTKFFSTGSITSALGTVAQVAPQAGERCPVVCVKAVDPAVDAWITGLTDDAVLVYMQEANRVSTPAATIAGYLALDKIRKANPNGHRVKLLLDLGTYRQVNQPQTGLDWTDFALPLKGVVDLVGSDTYVTPNMGGKWTPEKYLGWLAQAGQALGVPWCVPEFGVMVPAGGTEQAAADLYGAATAYCRANGAAWLNYWWGSGSNGDWRHPADSPLTAALCADVKALAGVGR